MSFFLFVILIHDVYFSSTFIGLKDVYYFPPSPSHHRNQPVLSYSHPIHNTLTSMISLYLYVAISSLFIQGSHNNSHLSQRPHDSCDCTEAILPRLCRRLWRLREHGHRGQCGPRQDIPHVDKGLGGAAWYNREEFVTAFKKLFVGGHWLMEWLGREMVFFWNIQIQILNLKIPHQGWVITSKEDGSQELTGLHLLG